MKKLNIKLIDGADVVNATLTIKETSLSINTENNELIKLSYDKIGDYQYDDSHRELVIIATDGARTELECIATNDLIDILEKCKSQNINKVQQPKISSKEHSNTSNNKYKAMLFMQKGQANVDISLLETKIKCESNNEILEIPYSSIIKVSMRDEDISLQTNNNNNFVIRCDDYKKLYDNIKSNKDESIYDTSSKISIIDVFGNDIIKANNNKNITKIIIIVVIVIAVILGIRGCMNMESSPADTIAWDIRNQDNILGYSTNYTIGEVISTKCSEEENDGKGRYIVKCNVQYYPKRNNGAIATDSKMNETIYAVFLRNDKDHFTRYYTKIVSDSFKNNTCWGQDKSKGITCIK